VSNTQRQSKTAATIGISPGRKKKVRKSAVPRRRRLSKRARRREITTPTGAARMTYSEVRRIALQKSGSWVRA